MDTMKIASMGQYTTDACLAEIPQNVDQLRELTKDMGALKQMELDLEEFEMVAIIFLLAAEYPGSYSTVLGLCRNITERPDIVSEYIPSNPEIETEKLIEAICIIGNHAILTNLGYRNPQELLATYQARIPRYAFKVKPAVKVLYKLFESMDREKTEMFLNSIYEGNQITRQLDNSQYMELHALHWLQEKYISIAPDGTANFANLLKHLKPLGYYTEIIYHDVEHFSNSLTTSARALNADDSCSPEKQVPSTMYKSCVLPVVHIEDEVHEAKMIKKGLCLIINEVDYESETLQYKNREGSNCDRDNLRNTFTRRDFDVRIEEDLSKRSMKRVLKEVCENFDAKKYDCLIVCILSHGYEGGIVTCDGLEISNKDIEILICINKLRNVIKLLIVQACQGKSLGDMSEASDLATDGRSESDAAIIDSSESDLSTDGPTEKLQPYNHFCRFMSTMNRFLSIRDIKKGTWFIEAICQELSKAERISISDWELAVKRNVQRREGHVDGLKTASQLPEFTSRLPMKVYFPLYVPA